MGGQLRSTNLCNTDSNLFSPPHCTDDPVLAGDQQNISQSDLLMEATKYRASVLNYDSESVLIEIFVFLLQNLYSKNINKQLTAALHLLIQE